MKEIFFFEDSTPTHSYMRMTYRYPQATFPYDELVRRNAARSKLEPEFELWDTEGVLRDDRFFDITIEYTLRSLMNNYEDGISACIGQNSDSVRGTPSPYFNPLHSSLQAPSTGQS